jgi:hypothetical protein
MVTTDCRKLKVCSAGKCYGGITATTPYVKIGELVLKAKLGDLPILSQM